jgi:uncharacterized repeat protein (TIGR03847 family)
VAVSTADRFLAGAIGPPGDREFRLEVATGGETVAYVIEKVQVATLAAEAQRLLRDLGMIGSGLSQDPGEIHPDTPVGFRVGAVQLLHEPGTEQVTVVLHPAEEGAGSVSYDVSPAQLDAFAREAVEVVAAGRPTCPRCGLAMDPDGHNCPRSNGDLRGYRP